MEIQIEKGGVLEVFGLGELKSWRVADDDFLALAQAKARCNSAEALSLANALVKSKGLGGVIRFRCACATRVVPLSM